MKTKILLLAVVLLVITVTEGHPTALRDNLKGLQGFAVLVMMDEPNLEKNGVTRDQLQTRVEVKLRQAGIRILSDSEAHETPGQPVLVLKVTASKLEPVGGYSFAVQLWMFQRVILDRDRKRIYSGPTWEDSRAGFAGFDRVRELYDATSDVLDVFINDYLAVNPK